MPLHAVICNLILLLKSKFQCVQNKLIKKVYPICQNLILFTINVLNLLLILNKVILDIVTHNLFRTWIKSFAKLDIVNFVVTIQVKSLNYQSLWIKLKNVILQVLPDLDHKVKSYSNTLMFNEKVLDQI